MQNRKVPIAIDRGGRRDVGLVAFVQESSWSSALEKTRGKEENKNLRRKLQPNVDGGLGVWECWVRGSGVQGTWNRRPKERA